MSIETMIANKEVQLKELVERSRKSDDVQELRSINQQMDAINKDIAELRQLDQSDSEGDDKDKKDDVQKDDADDKDDEENERTKAVTAGETRSKQYVPGKGFHARGVIGGNKAEAEQRGSALKEGRSVTVATTGIIIPQHDSNTITDHFNQISSLIDNVGHLEFNGGDTFRQPFAIDTPVGGYTVEGTEYASAESTFGQADIRKTKVTAIADYSEELEKLPAAPYAEYVTNGVLSSIRRKITQEILIGDGSDGHLTGIFSTAVATKQDNSPVPIIDSSKDLAFTSIDDTTLDRIVFNFGGDEDVEGAAVLILNKADLLAFASVRTAQKQRFYEIEARGNYGTINGIPYIINSACSSISNGKAGEFAMAYGNLANYQLVTFSPVDVKKSYDSKFREGMVSVRGSLFVGGNVVRQNGFVRVKVGATSSTSKG